MRSLTFDSVKVLKLIKELPKLKYNNNIMTQEMQREVGIVKKINDKYGFIMPYTGPERFFHWSSISKESMKPFHFLRVGDKVFFTPHSDNGRPQAREIEFVFEKREDNGRQ